MHYTKKMVFGSWLIYGYGTTLGENHQFEMTSLLVTFSHLVSLHFWNLHENTYVI
jgi:hypothetical protein